MFDFHSWAYLIISKPFSYFPILGEKRNYISEDAYHES